MNNHEHTLWHALERSKELFEAFWCNSMFTTASKYHFWSSRLDDFAVRSLPKIQRLIWRLDDFGWTIATSNDPTPQKNWISGSLGKEDGRSFVASGVLSHGGTVNIGKDGVSPNMVENKSFYGNFWTYSKICAKRSEPPNLSSNQWSTDFSWTYDICTYHSWLPHDPGNRPLRKGRWTMQWRWPNDSWQQENWSCLVEWCW